MIFCILLHQDKSTLKKFQCKEYPILGIVREKKYLFLGVWIFSIEKRDGVFYEREMGHARLIVGYSESRAKKDRYNRDKGVRLLEKSYKSGMITKENINKRGYNEFLKLSNNVEVVINRDMIKEDEQWDGLNGYITNTNLLLQRFMNNTTVFGALSVPIG